MADYVVRLSGQDNLSGTIKQCKQAVQDFGTTASTQMDKFKQRFERIEGSAAPLKKQLRDLKSLMSEMNFKGLSGTEEFTRIAQYAGQVKDAMDDAGAAAKRFADDTFALKAAADAFTLVTGATTALTGAMNLFGVENEKVKEAILKVQSAIAILNGVQAVANALNKDSALMQAMKALKMKIVTEYTRLNTKETNNNTTSEIANKAATEADAVAKGKSAIATNVETGSTKKGTIAQNAWNMAKAIGKALLGDFTGLAIVAAGAAATYAMAVSDSTDKIEDQNEAYRKSIPLIDANAEAIKRNKEQQNEWGKTVASNVAEQLAKYDMLRKKWAECNGDVKLQGKFLNDYAKDIKDVTGRQLDLISAEDIFVKKTDDVVAAIKARAEAEAGKELYKKAYQTKLENDYNGTVANGRYRPVAHTGDTIGNGYLTKEAMSAAGLTGSDLDFGFHKPRLTESGANKMNAYWLKRMKELSKVDTDAVDYWEKFYYDREKKAVELEKKAGIGGGGANGVNKKTHGSSSKSGTTTTKKTEEEVKPVAQSLEWLRQQLQELQKQLSYGLIPADKIDETKEKIDYLKKDIEKKEIELGFKIVPSKGSLNDLENQLSKLQDDLSNGLIPDDQINDTEDKIDDLTKRIKAKKIQLGFEEAPETDYEKRIDDYLQYINDTEKAAKRFADAKLEIDNELKAADTKLAEQLRSGVITQAQYVKEVEKLWEDYADKMGNLPEVVVYNKPPKSMDNIARFYEDEIEKIEKALSENDLDIEARIELNEKKADLQRKLSKLVNGELSIPAKIEIEYIIKGSNEDFRASYENASQQIQQIADDYSIGIIKTFDEAAQKIAEINAELLKLGMKPIEIEIKTKGQQVIEDTQEYLGKFNDVVVGTVDSISQLVKSIDEGASGWEIFKNAISTAEQIMNSIGIVMQTINTLTQAHTAATIANTVATSADAAASTGNAIAKSAEASATAGVAVAETAAQNAKMGPWGWVAAIAGAVALAAVLFSTIGKFAGGGIIGGHSYSGDKLIARVNSGEMILNNRQQRNLFNAINNGELGGGNAQTVSFRLKGSDIYGALKNYQKIKGKSGIVTGIQ